MDFCKYIQYKDMWHALLKKKLPTSEIFTEPYTYVIIYSTTDLISSFTQDSVLTHNQKDGRVQILGAFKSSFTY